MISKKMSIILISVLCGAHVVSSANIFVYVILGGYSHRLSMMPFVEELADAGHNVTFISSYPNKNPHPKIHDFVPKLWQSRMGDWSDHMNFFDLRARGRILKVWEDVPSLGILACKSLYEDDEFVEWMRSVKFDLVIVDTMYNDCVYGMAHLWNAKIIVYSTANVMGWFQESYGMPDETSSMTDPVFSWQVNDQMNFIQRFINAMSPLVWTLYRDYIFYPEIEEISRRGLQKVTGKEVNFPPFTEINKNVSLVMVSSHYSMSFPRSLPPNIVQVGGVTISPKTKPLPKEFEEFIGNHNFIFVSFGSVGEFTQFTPTERNEFIESLEAFPEFKFIWKSTRDITDPLPKNVKVVKWAPQTSLLAHPKIKGFVSHSGLGSMTEAITFGVPVVSCPVFAEQDMNTAWLVSRGAALMLEVTEFKRDEIIHAIREISENPKYKNGMRKLQTLFKDRPMLPTKSARWWAEFVLRHDNINDFLRPPSVHQSWWVKRQIDVWIVFTLLILAIVMTLLFIIFKIVKRLLWSSSSKKLKGGRKKEN